MSGTEAASRAAPPERVVDHPAWREALGQVRAALAQPQPIIAVLGLAGTGKTLLLRALHDDLRAAGRDPVLLARGDAETHPAAPHGAPGIVLVDEADRIDPATLRALTEAGIHGVVLAALPAFAERLESVRGATVVMLRTLQPEAAAAFVRARVAAGAPGQIAGDAVTEIVAHTEGVPRLLGALTMAAEFVAALQAAPEVTAAHVQEAVLLRGDVGAGLGTEAPPEPTPGLPFAGPQEAGSRIHPDPGERWAESTGATRPAPARRRRARLWAALSCAAAAALFMAYAARQPAGERLGRRVAALLPGHPAPSPVPADAGAAPTAFAVEVASNQAAGVAPPVSTQAPADPAPGPGPRPPASGLPRGVVPHVVLSYWQGDGEAERRAVEVARTLRAAGIVANDPVPLLQRVAEPRLAYFFAEDRAGAAEVGRALGGIFGEGRAAALHQDEPLPRPGTIELQISSEQSETAERAR